MSEELNTKGGDSKGYYGLVKSEMDMNTHEGRSKVWLLILIRCIIWMLYLHQIVVYRRMGLDQSLMYKRANSESRGTQ